MEYSTDLDKIARHIGVAPKEIFTDKPERCHFIWAGIYHGQMVLVKVFSNKNFERVENFKKEFQVDKILEKYSVHGKINRTKVLEQNTNEKYSWLIRCFYPGSTLCANDPSVDFFIDRMSSIDDNYKDDRILMQIINNLKQIQSIKLGSIEQEDKNRFPVRFLKSFSRANLELVVKNLEITLDRQVEFCDKFNKLYFDEKKLVACTGDLMPANIIITESSEVLFSDFEWFSFDNAMVDVSYLWLFLSREKAWQNKLIENFVLNENDKIDFRLSIIRELIHWYCQLYDSNVENTPIIERARRRHKEYIWRDYLIAAGDSFEALVGI